MGGMGSDDMVQLGFEHLPREVLCYIYGLVECSYSTLGPTQIAAPGIRDRLRGVAVCKAWLAALSGLLFGSWKLQSLSCTEQLCWLVKTRPAIHRLSCWGLNLGEAQAGLLQQALQSLQAQNLRELELTGLWTLAKSASGAPLSYPTCVAAFPCLASCTMDLHCQDDIELAARLAALPALRRLKLVRCISTPPSAGAQPSPFVAPASAGLTSLELRGFQEAAVDLSALPSLQRLLAGAGRMHLVGAAVSTSRCSLSHLELSLTRRFNGTSGMDGSLVLAIPALPALEVLLLAGVHSLEGAAALGAASGLTRLRLADCSSGVRRGILEAIPRQVALSLDILRPPLSEPSPATAPVDLLPNLRSLSVPAASGSDWLQGLAALHHLQAFEIVGGFGFADPRRQVFAAPGVASLTRLKLELCNAQTVEVNLSRFPLLRCLQVAAPAATVRLVCTGRRRSDGGQRAAVSQLKQVLLRANVAMLDPRHLPALQSLQLEMDHRHSSLAAATALRALVLAFPYNHKCGLVEQVLSRGPSPSLQGLCLRVHSGAQLLPLGRLPQGLPATSAAPERVFGLPRLRALDINLGKVACSQAGLETEGLGLMEALESVLSEGQPLWEQLEALAMPLPLPQGLQCAPRLKRLRLKCRVDPQSFQRQVLPQLELLQSLLVLEQLEFVSSCTTLRDADAECLYRALPRLWPITLVNSEEEAEGNLLAFLESVLAG